jgi:hypothetical protein
MPIVSVRDLAHDMKAVLSRLDEDNETLLARATANRSWRSYRSTQPRRSATSSSQRGK